MQQHYSILLILMALSIAACSSSEPVKIAYTDKNIDYAQHQNIHINESNVDYHTMIETIPYEKSLQPETTVLCFDGSIVVESKNACSKAGGIKERFRHYHAN